MADDDDAFQPLPLDQLAIEWVEPRVCEETFENRRRLRENRNRWQTVPPNPDTGMPSGLIQVRDPAWEARGMHAKYADVLVDPRDPWSDYVDVREIPMDATGVPYWIHQRAEQWKRWDASEGKPSVSSGRGVVAKPHAGREPHLPTRCKSTKRDGTRCWGWAADAANDGHCRGHAPGAALAANMGHQIALARIKVMQAMPAMVDELEQLALESADERVRLKAVTEMMDRGGVRAGSDVSVDVTSGGQSLVDPAEAIRERLADLGDKLKAKAELEGGDVVEGEVVGEGEAP